MSDFEAKKSMISRRSFCVAGIGTLSTLALGNAFANEQATDKVWQGLTQAELDDAYTQSVYAPNMKTVLKRYVANSDVVRQRLGDPKRIAYGETEHEKFDLFPSADKGKPIHIFLHGGAWKAGSSDQYSFLAETFVRHGANCIVPDFINVKQSNGDLRPMADQVRNCVKYVYENADQFGGDKNQIYVSGHSSGGHLAGVLVTTDWSSLGLPADVIKGAVIVSGLYDLEPVRLSVRSDYLNFTDEIESELSPQRHIDRINAPLILAHGSLETPEFIRQTEDFAKAAKAAGKKVDLYIGDEYNHFEIIETMANPLGIIGTPALKQMQLL